MSKASIVESMAQVLWAIANGYDSMADHPDDSRTYGVTPPAAVKAAKDLAELYEIVNNDDSVYEILRRTQAEKHWRRSDPKHFGWLLATSATRGATRLGARGGYRINVPEFSIWIDHGELRWEGGEHGGSEDFERNPRNPGRAAYPGDVILAGPGFDEATGAGGESIAIGDTVYVISRGFTGQLVGARVGDRANTALEVQVGGRTFMVKRTDVTKRGVAQHGTRVGRPPGVPNGRRR